jgi:esterase
MQLFSREYGSGRPGLILHGLFGQSDNWNSIAKTLSESGLNIYTLDLRNHGLSPHSDEWTYAAMAEDVHQFITERGLEDPFIIGHSMGAKVQMFFEWKHPGIVRDHVIADMSARAYPPHHDSVISALRAVDLAAIKTRKDAESVMAEYIDDFGTRQFLLKNLHHTDGGFRWRFNLDVIADGYTHILEPVPDFKSAARAMVIRGERSTYVNENDLSDFRARFNHVDVVTVAGAGHWVHADKPAEFIAAVKKFIAA